MRTSLLQRSLPGRIAQAVVRTPGIELGPPIPHSMVPPRRNLAGQVEQVRGRPSRLLMARLRSSCQRHYSKALKRSRVESTEPKQLVQVHEPVQFGKVKARRHGSGESGPRVNGGNKELRRLLCLRKRWCSCEARGSGGAYGRNMASGSSPERTVDAPQSPIEQHQNGARATRWTGVWGIEVGVGALHPGFQWLAARVAAVTAQAEYASYAP